MAQKTSWEGSLTRVLRRRGLKGGYARYTNRRRKTGLEFVVPRQYDSLILTPSGQLKGREIKFHNYSGKDKTANQIYNKEIKKFLKPIRRR